MDIAERFGADVSVNGPDPDSRGFFFVKRRDDVGHVQFLAFLIRSIGGADKILFHHKNGFAVVWVSFELSQWLGRQQPVESVGGVQVDQERLFNAILPSDWNDSQ